MARAHLAIGECVQPVLDRDLLVLGNRPQGMDVDAAADGIGVATMVQVGARREKHSDVLEVELSDVLAEAVRELAYLVGTQDPPVTTTEDELTLSELAPGKHPESLRSCLPHLGVSDHC